MRKGFIFTCTIRAMSSEGAGITDLPDDGRVVFVPGACLGETVKVKLIQVKSKYAHAQIVELEQASAVRTQPACVHHGFAVGQCGGCPWMYLSYDEQLRLKQSRVRDLVARLTEGLTSVNPIQASKLTLGYRNRAQLKTDGQSLGFISFGSDQLAAIESCKVLSEINQAQLTGLLESLPKPEWKPKNKKQLTSLDINEVTRGSGPSVNKRLPFHQANTEQNVFMRDWLKTHLQVLEGKGSMLELFCGAGNFTEVIEQAGYEKIRAVDAVTPALAELRQKQLKHAEVIQCDLFDELACASLIKKGARDSEILLLDPPRDGFKTRMLFMQELKKLRDIVYISCDLATWHRDAQDFIRAGFHLIEVQPVDLFPQTPHVELLSFFSKSKASRRALKTKD